ncbi:DUF1289 domain-containing protein [Pseudomonas sp. GX19020]|nr:DUF1289 domain-containing protein [Pseudomonas sp. GX19020]MCL4066805.1 DUF1289 domain-containing protein [Pseudomonas sp. GX19020]
MDERGPDDRVSEDPGTGDSRTGERMTKDPGPKPERQIVKDDIWARNEIESPCVKICVIHSEAKICVGCYRTLSEIGAWSSITAPERRRIMDELPSRAASLVKRRGGRAARLGRGEE